MSVDNKRESGQSKLERKFPTDECSACPLCGGIESEKFLFLGSIALHVSVFAESAELARDAAMGQIELANCLQCGFIWNSLYQPEILIFEPGYEASLINSRIFREYIDSLTSRLVSKYSLQHRNILEIGCGDGSFLRLLCEKGGNNGTGIDPTIKREKIEHLNNGQVEFIRDYFGESYTQRIGDFICCLSVLEDISEPLSFLKNLRRMIGSRSEVVLYFEVPNVQYMLKKQMSWSLYYEQCNHFSLQTLESAFRCAGFDVLESGESYEDGQYVYIEARPSLREPESTFSHQSSSYTASTNVASFSASYRNKLSNWGNRLAQMKKAKQRVAVWGTGGKGVGFLNALNTADSVQFVIDINPERWGKFVPGSAQEIVSPESLKTHQPDVIIITNPLYRTEIEEQIFQLGVDAEVLLLQ